MVVCYPTPRPPIRILKHPPCLWELSSSIPLLFIRFELFPNRICVAPIFFLPFLTIPCNFYRINFDRIPSSSFSSPSSSSSSFVERYILISRYLSRYTSQILLYYTLTTTLGRTHARHVLKYENYKYRRGERERERSERWCP